MAWLTDQFGRDRLRDADIILPTEDYFPDAYDATEDDVRAILDRVCGYMEVDPEKVSLHFYQDRNPIAENRTAGVYQGGEGVDKVWIEYANLADPLGLVATMAHELGQVLLLSLGKISPEEEDHEPLTDLLTVFLGLGVFTANSVIRESYEHAGAVSRWSMSRRGYLTMPMYGYALALFARERGEERPAWVKHLRPDVASAYTQASRFLALGGEMPPEPDPHDASHVQDKVAMAADADDGKPGFSMAPEELLRRYATGERSFADIDLPRVRLSRADLSGCNLSGADFQGSDLWAAILDGCDLSEADLRGAILRSASMRKANLHGAQLTGADLTAADLSGADIRDADFGGARLELAKLDGAVRNATTNFSEPCRWQPDARARKIRSAIASFFLVFLALFCGLLAGALVGFIGSNWAGQWPGPNIAVPVGAFVGVVAAARQLLLRHRTLRQKADKTP